MKLPAWVRDPNAPIWTTDNLGSYLLVLFTATLIFFTLILLGGALLIVAIDRVLFGA